MAKHRNHVATVLKAWQRSSDGGYSPYGWRYEDPAYVEVLDREEAECGKPNRDEPSRRVSAPPLPPLPRRSTATVTQIGNRSARKHEVG